MKTMRKSNNRIVKLLMIMALGVLMMSGCQQVNNVVNSNTATNGNTAANSNASANANANSNTTANSNANTSASPNNSTANSNTSASNTAANTATAAKEEEPLTAEEQEFKNTLVGEWKNDKMIITFTETEFSSKLNDGTVNAGPYQVVNENTIEAELTRTKQKFKATMSFEDDGKTLNWSDPSGKYKYTRIK